MDVSHLERTALLQKIRRLSPPDFEAVALAVFRYQSKHCPIYREYLQIINKQADSILGLQNIPFLPIQLFKTRQIRSGAWKQETLFTSSGTTGAIPSRHAVRSLSWYDEVTFRGFQQFYGRVRDYCILALLPSYLERSSSSLVYMARSFIQTSKYAESGFFLRDYESLIRRLEWCRAQQIPTILLGVSFALLDLAEQYPMNLEGITIMETGGMKGRRKEMTREELHRCLQEAFQVKSIHSEYGMTELLSQGYSQGHGIFQPAPTMRIMVREVTDPYTTVPSGSRGVLNIIDLANIDTISFIGTEDLGRSWTNGTFEVLGRLDQSDVRGCNLMLEL